MTRTLLNALLVLLLLSITGCESDDYAETDVASSSQNDAVALGAAARASDDDEKEIPLSEVPDNVMEAALDAVPGIVFEEAEREVEGDVLVYELEGAADGECYEVEVSAAGEVLEIESEDDEEDDDDDDDDDD